MMIITQDKEKRKKLIESISNNSGHCPCMIEQNEDTICPCKWRREEEICVCGLYEKVEE